ncbi:MAG: PEP-utilizing enzyme [SAR202 cluster bacterium]|jgi:pyruvate,water dikinase|nr:PEP-utilizing enzyme [SAR202 cluster bacterium]MDP6512161.1 PEP-utilizing enzyme [SAR202 cluster bacterium]MDP6716442.1 PEP-utilizing enzyme [SAR202 cluster bacterium]
MLESDDQFPVSWDDPDDALRHWEFDPMHAPDVITPLGYELLDEQFLKGFGLGTDVRLVNHYMFMHVELDEAPPPRSFDDMLRRLAAAWPQWQNRILPEVERYIEFYRATDFDAMSNDGLSGEIDRLLKTRRRQGRLHSQAVMPWFGAMNLLLDAYRKLTGGSFLDATRLIQGHGNKSVEAGRELWKLSRIAGSVPDVRDRLGEVTPDTAQQTLDMLQSNPDAQPFLKAFSKYLDDYGWRSDLFDFSIPTWAENPAIPLSQLRAYLEMEDYDPDQELLRLQDERDQAVQDTLAQIKPEDQRRFEGVLEVAASLSPLQEDHNFYIDQRLAFTPRRLALAIGRRLVSDGHIDDPPDVFYLNVAHVRAALNSEGADYQAVVGRYRKDLAQWAKITPPSYVGAPRPTGISGFSLFDGRNRFRADQPNVLRGNPSSPGTASGPARILMNLGQADRLKPGDVLVARTTMPAWTPLFGVASAIVVETGGVLSHAAVTAREYGIPAVLGVANATTNIRDGQLLEVSGSEGRVRKL